ncbi:MAG: thioredoxin-dependent thiol peroxidase [Calditrichaeota bacterium]|nr:MAG: thioredoxin-dependent thiol peroxidase [Calditrichota bacterium]
MSDKKELQAGDNAPGFKLTSSSGESYSLDQFIGKKRVILYFYPKDDTPGCTKEACSFRDHMPAINHKDAIVLGVSADPSKSHQKFIEKYGLNFPLLSDEDHQVAEAYGAWGEKKMYGKSYMGLIRKTFVIGMDGKIEYAFHKVTPEGHGEEIMALL